MSNVIIKILDLIRPFQSWYETLKQEYEKNVMACITNEKWNDIFQETFGGDTCNWLRALALASIKENKYIGKFDFVEDSEITYGIDSNPIKISESGFTRNLSPCCIPSFWGDNISENIMKLIACFNESDKERRIFNEVHCYAGDTTITIGMGHFAAENVGEFFREMPEQIWKEMRDCIQECINGNKNILTDKKNTNIHSDYKTQFWNDYVKVVDNDPSLNENDKKSKTQKEGSITTEHLDYFFRNEKNKDDKKIKNQIQIRCDAAYNEIMKNKKKLWGEGNVLKHNMLLYRFAMKDTYETKARRYYECAVKRNLSTPQLTVDIEKLKDSKISETHGTGITSLESLRKKLEDLSVNKKQIESEDYDIYLKIFNSGIEKFNINLNEAGKALSKALGLGNEKENNILKGDKVDIYDNYDALKKVLQPYPGNQEYSGYWFYDIMKVALRLRSVCYYQLYYWTNNVLKHKNGNDAANAAATSWNSSRFKGELDKYENCFLLLKNANYNLSLMEAWFGSTDNFKELSQNEKESLADNSIVKIISAEKITFENMTKFKKNLEELQAFAYWHNYNVLRAESEGKKYKFNEIKKKEKSNKTYNYTIVRSRQEEIWSLWFKDYLNGCSSPTITMDNLKNIQPMKNKHEDFIKRNGISTEFNGFNDFLKNKLNIQETEQKNNSNKKTK